MPSFTVLRRVDAYATYEAVVEAESAEDAAHEARENEEDYDWQHSGVQMFDARSYVTLDADGDEIESTLVGDL